jgi:hypothetical protein
MFYPLFYKRFGYKSTKQWYYVLRIDWVRWHPRILFWRHENKCWDLNVLLLEALRKAHERSN